MAPLRHAVHVLPDVLIACARRRTPTTRRSSRPSSLASTCWPTTWRGGCAPSRRRGPPTGRPPPWTIPLARCAPPSVASTSSSPVWTTPNWSRSPTTRTGPIAQVLSHLGSGAVIMRRRLEDIRAGTATPDDFAPVGVGRVERQDARAQADDALVADEAVLQALEAVDEGERARLTFSMGPLSPRLQRSSPACASTSTSSTAGTSRSSSTTPPACPPTPPPWWSTTSPSSRASAGGPTARSAPWPCGPPTPSAHVTLRLSADGVELTRRARAGARRSTLPAEALWRLVYGRLDPDHTPAFTGDAALLDALRAVFPGP